MNTQIFPVGKNKEAELQTCLRAGAAAEEAVINDVWYVTLWHMALLVLYAVAMILLEQKTPTFLTNRWFR